VNCPLPAPILYILAKLAIVETNVITLPAIVGTPVTMRLTSHLPTATTSLLRTVSPLVCAPTDVSKIDRHMVFLAGDGLGTAERDRVWRHIGPRAQQQRDADAMATDQSDRIIRETGRRTRVASAFPDGHSALVLRFLHPVPGDVADYRHR
jgi:hypothetical protein